jgi:hypothetical protein
MKEADPSSGLGPSPINQRALDHQEKKEARTNEKVDG